MLEQFKGTGVALVTPFKEDGSIDFDGLESLINYNIEGGVEYLVSLGTTGEAATLTKEEKHKVLDFTVKIVNKRVPVVAGFGGSSTQGVIDDIKDYHFEGISAILSASPAYNKPTQEGIYHHYVAVAGATKLPVILYNVPGRTASNMTAATTLRLARDVENIIGIKEASGSFAQVMEIIKHRPGDFLVISGDDLITLPLVASGADGVISVIANAFPAEFSTMVRDTLANDAAKARLSHYPLLEMMDLIFREGNPGGIKAVLHQLGVCGDQVRLPLYRVSTTLYDDMRPFVQAIKGEE